MESFFKADNITFAANSSQSHYTESQYTESFSGFFEKFQGRINFAQFLSH